jgi:hypothetical protein
MSPTRRTLASVVAASLLLSSCSDDAERISRLSVVGEATVDLSPDTAVIVVSVVTQSAQALAAQQANARITATIDSALTKRFGAKATMRSRGYSLQPQHRYNAKSMPSIIGYEARNSVEIALGDLARVGEAVDAATAAGANSVESVTFELRNLEQAHARALTEASKRATIKARAMADAVGARIVRIIEGGEVDPYPPVRPFDYRYDGTTTDQANVGSVTTPIRPGGVEHRTTVRLMVEIEGGSLGEK